MPKPGEPRLIGCVIGGKFDGQSAVFFASAFADFALNPEEVGRVVNCEISTATIQSRGGVVWQVRRLPLAIDEV
jgi:hypothetical protein